MEALNETLGGLIISTGLVAIVYILAKYNYLIRKMMIEKGMEAPTIFKRSRLIDFACISLFIGIGVLISAFYTSLELEEDTMDLLIWGTILIVGSFGPALAYTIRRRSGE
ncbi:MAG: hypothetical protein AAGD28_15435 [Bacteroidota bacterium]